MRRPQGQLTIICDDPGKVGAVDCYGRSIEPECDTYTCSHCDRIVFVMAREKPEDIGGMCHLCMKLMCPHCTNIDGCRPLEKRLEMVERRYETLRSYGLA